MKKLLSTVLTSALILSSSITAFAGDYSITINYNGVDHVLNTISGTDISGNTSIEELEQAIASGELNGGTPAKEDILLIHNGRACLIDDNTLSNEGIKSGDKLYLYDFYSSAVIVKYQGKDYVININSDRVEISELKTLIANEISLEADKITLLDSTGNSLTGGSVIAGASISVSSYPNDMITTTEDGYNQSSKDVSATYTDESVSGTVYAVDITWGAMEFNYTSATKYNPETHKEEVDATKTGWNYNGTNTIKVENHSNAAVKASFRFIADNNYTAGNLDGFTANAADITNNTSTSLVNNSIVLDSAVGKEADAPATANVKLELNGKLADPGENGIKAKIGTVTVTIE